MPFNAITLVALTYLFGRTTALTCLPNISCPAEKCSDQSTTLCTCPDIFTACDFSNETCSGRLGTCIPIKIVEAVAFEAPVSTVTVYTGTTSTYTTVYTVVQTVFYTQSDQTTETVYDTKVILISSRTIQRLTFMRTDGEIDDDIARQHSDSLEKACSSWHRTPAPREASHSGYFH